VTSGGTPRVSATPSSPSSSSLLALRVAAAASLALAPVLAWQGWRVRRTVPVLRDADGPVTGDAVPATAPLASPAPPLSLLVLGESTAAGMGAPTHRDALAGRTAQALAELTGRRVRWRVVGRSGATAQAARTLFEASFADAALPDDPAAARVDVAVVALGVNDVLAFRGDRAWTRDLDALVQALRVRCGDAPIVVAAVPPLHCFPALRQPLRWALGTRARLLDAAAARWATRVPRVAHAPASTLESVATGGLFAADGFHPSPEGYRLWGESLALVAASLLGAASTAERSAA
jgi:lysophospholipase L1-like esterase